MNLIILKYFAAFAVLLVPVIAGAIPLVWKKQDKAFAFVKGEAFACGIFLGASLLHMLPHALHADSSVPSKQVLLWVGTSFLGMLLLEHISRYFADHNQRSLPLIATTILSIHSISAGIALGMAKSPETLMVVLVAILSHKWAAGFALAVLLVRSLQSNVWLPYGLFVLMTPIGIFFGHQLIPVHNHEIGIYVHAIAAGTFLYIGTLHGLKQAVLVDRCCDLKAFVWVLIGFASMAIIG